MTKKKKIPHTQEELKRRFFYDPETGILYHMTPCTGTAKGYVQVWISGEYFYAHRIIWKLVTGNDPGQLLIDHINGNTLDNTLANLRLVTDSQNQINKTPVTIEHRPRAAEILQLVTESKNRAK